LRSNLAFFSLFFFLDITFLLLAISHFNTIDNQVNIPIQKAGGIAGIISSMFAWWTASAGMINKENSFFTIPVSFPPSPF
jgi:succinate-acetate transporter protein